MSPDLLKLIFGRLGFESLPLHEPIVVGTFAVVALGGAGHQGLNNTLPLAYDKYARRGTVLGPEPSFVAGTCTPDAPQGKTTASIAAPTDTAPLLGAGLKRPPFTPLKSSFFLG